MKQITEILKFGIKSLNLSCHFPEQNSKLFEIFPLALKQSEKLKSTTDTVVQKCLAKKRSSSAGVSFKILCQLQDCKFVKKETPTKVSSYEFCEVFQNSFLRRFSRLIAFAANWGKIDLSSRSSDQRCSIKRPVLKNFEIFTRKNLRWSFLRPSGMNIYQEEAPTQVFFCEYCEIIKNTYFEKHLRANCFFHFHNAITTLAFSPLDIADSFQI